MPAPTVDAAWIAEHLSDPLLRVIEVDASPAAYDEGHIPGAVFWNAYTDLRDGAYQPVDRAELEDLFARSGIRAEATVVVYGYAAPLGFWLLTANGFDGVRMLDAPRDEWVRGGELWSKDTPAPVNEPLELPAQRDTVIATRDEVARAIGNPATLILDVRSDLEYSGERFWPSGATEVTGRSGHIPGAVNVPIDRMRTDTGQLKAPDELQRVLDDAGVSKDKTVITYCTIGNRASQAWFALTYLLGYPNVEVYYGSWVDWGKQDDTPVEK